MLRLCKAEGIGVIPWSPLARGFLAGNRTAKGQGETTRATSDAFADHLYFTEGDFKVAAAVGEVAKARGAPNMQVALAWVMSKPVVTSPILGASKLEHIDDAVAALGLKLTDDEVKALEAPYLPKPVQDHG